MHCLREQTIRDRIEVIIVTPDPVSVALEAADRDAFHTVRVVECSGALNMAAARAVGIRSANAPWVWIGEDHSFPDAQTAESLLERHRDGYAVVGPQMANANPGSTLSWVSFVSAYASFAKPARSGETDCVAGHNSSYAVASLIALGNELPVLLAAEAVLHWQLRSSGERVFLEPRATLWHVNSSRLAPHVQNTFASSRLFAAVWSRHWPLGRRLRFALLSPGIAARRVGLMLRVVRATAAAEGSTSRVLPLLLASAALTGMAYAVGFLFGTGRAMDSDWDHETRRGRFMNVQDRRLFPELT